MVGRSVRDAVTLGRGTIGADSASRLSTRRFEFVPLWGIKVFLVYAPRRVDCPTCGVRVEHMPWALGKHLELAEFALTQTYARFLARWARRLCWKEVAEVFHTSWESVFRSGRTLRVRGDGRRVGPCPQGCQANSASSRRSGHRDRRDRWRTLSSPRSTRTQRVRNHCKRLLWIGQERKVKTLLRFFRWFGAERSRELKYLCSDSEFASDMWKPYLKVIAKKAGRAVHVLDRFHIMAHFSKAIDEVRAKEVKELKRTRRVRGEGLRAGADQDALAAAQAPGESDWKARDQVGRFAALQPALGSSLSSDSVSPR